MKVLYLDLQAGAAGDMLLGALLGAGADEDRVRAVLGTLDLPGWTLEVEAVTRAGVAATKAHVKTEPSDEHRNLTTIEQLLEPLPAAVKGRALAAFRALAEAEAHVHGTTVDRVHFHEVGAVDAIVDIVGTCAALDDLGPELVIATAVPLGSGTVRAAHGELPVPAPATLELISRNAIPVVDGGEGETVTPTGAALIGTIADRFDDLPQMHIEAVGYGAGDRDTQQPNVVRAFVGERAPEPEGTTHVMIEANIDDMAPELFPYAIEALIRAGADDAWVTPIQMKKHRPAILLSVLTHPSRRSAVLDTLFRETTTLGCRVSHVEKEELERSWLETQVDGHAVRVKVARRGGEVVTMAPEYEDAVKAARATGRALKDVYEEASRRAAETQERSR